MRRQTLALVAVLALSTALTGCGRALPGSGTEVTGDYEREYKGHVIKEKQVLPASKVNPTKGAVTGVVVNGRVYPKGQEPKGTEAPTLEAPAAGKGHLQLFVALKNRAVQTETLKLVIAKKDQATDYTVKTIGKNEFGGTEVIRSLTNLAPGDYYVSLDCLGADGKPFTETENFEVKVEDGKTAQFKI